jgi:hypothetical protein
LISARGTGGHAHAGHEQRSDQRDRHRRKPEPVARHHHGGTADGAIA